MGYSLPPSIHDVKPDDVEVMVIRDRQVSVTFGIEAGTFYPTGCSDRERLENLVAIAGRMRRAALDLIAELVVDGDTDVHRSSGKPTPLPDAAPLHGQTVTAVRP